MRVSSNAWRITHYFLRINKETIYLTSPRRPNLQNQFHASTGVTTELYVI